MSNIKFGDSVEITDGFYEDCKGIVLEENENKNYYKVELHKCCKDNAVRSVEKQIPACYLKIISK